MKSKIIIYGIGKVFSSIYDTSIGITAFADIVALADKNYTEYIGKYPYDVMGINDIRNYDYDLIVVTSNKYYEDIRTDLINQGITSDNIVSLNEFVYRCLTDIIGKQSLAGKGVDIGGPSGAFEEIYRHAVSMDIVNFSKTNTWSTLDKQFVLEGKIVGTVIENDATMLTDIEDSVYDFVLSSNNLEHIANPLLAVAEWYRVLKQGGVLAILVPAKEYCFDHNRKVVLFDHLLDDYKNNVKEDDLSHINEILELHDLDMDKPAGTYEQFKERCYRNFECRCLHQHVFDADVLKKIFDYFKMEILISDIIYQGCHVMIGRK